MVVGKQELLRMALGQLLAANNLNQPENKVACAKLAEQYISLSEAVGSGVISV